jgi:tripartite-type tricarboxylate transporter receptor subunit TctC
MHNRGISGFSWLRPVLILALLGLFSLPSDSQAENAKDFYQGKRITIIVQYSTGGSFDIHARWLARHLPKYTGTDVIVQNVPGGGGVIGYNKLFQSAPDGLTLLTAHTKMIAFELSERKGVKYKFSEFAFLGRTMGSDTALIIKKDMPTDLNDLRKMKRIRVGASSPFYEGLFAEALGLKNLTIVPGYGGFSERIAAIMRGELEATVGSVTGALKYKDAVKILTAIFPDKRVPEAPTLESIQASQPWGDYLKSFTGLMRATVTSPGVPDERARFLENTLKKVTEDPDALKEAKKLKLVIEWVEPSELKKQIEVFKGLTADARKGLDEIITKKYVGALR